MITSAHLINPFPLSLPPKTLKHQTRNCHVSPRMSLQQPNDLLTTVSKLLWGKSLPPQLLISTVRSTWNATWHLMMRQLAPSDPTGSYSRPISQFPAKFKSSSPQFSRQKTKNHNFHLYVALSCPWAHRTLIVRALKNLESEIPVSIAAPGIDGMWQFRDSQEFGASSSNGESLIPGADAANGCRTLKEVYRLRRGGYDGRSTVPMLWDVDNKEVVCNESYDIIELFNSGSDDLGFDLSPVSLKGEIEAWNQIIYPNVNNGVYRCGFAQSQEAYNMAVNALFNTLDMLDGHLATSRYLCGDVLTLADVCLFTTLIRFDLAYNVLFRCTKKKLLEYPNLHGYTRDIYQIPKVAPTCNFEAIMDGYYRILFPLNPGSLQPIMPSSCTHDLLCEPHNRESLSSMDKHAKIPVS
eukprot:TRINITY_DN503_c0_g1_i1.p1 TRINITY_DN503_c0_g1~~TRINITY_DN503_c0_g1_i1.p1  ORF type:complete len:410 (+),score=23.47 TRINITY_DN503_c0_g1_i1:76-1305(+)